MHVFSFPKTYSSYQRLPYIHEFFPIMYSIHCIGIIKSSLRVLVVTHVVLTFASWKKKWLLSLFPLLYDGLSITILRFIQLQYTSYEIMDLFLLFHAISSNNCRIWQWFLHSKRCSAASMHYWQKYWTVKLDGASNARWYAYCE